MKFHRALIASLVAGAGCWSAAAVGQSFPTKPIRMLVTYAPGGASDINARILGPKMTESLGVQVIVDNRTGASGVIATGILHNSTPDGHTLALVDGAHAANPALFRKLPYDTVKDFKSIGMVTRVPMVFVVHPSFPAASVKEMVALAKAKPGAFNYASAGTGTPTFLAAELFKTATGIDLVHIAYKGGGPALAEVVAGQVPMMFISVAASMPHVKAGRARALGITSEQRIPQHPEVPTVAEGGVPGYHYYLWQTILAPAATPAPVIARLNKELLAALGDAAVRERMIGLGQEPLGGTPAQADDFLRAEVGLWAKVIKPEMRIN